MATIRSNMPAHYDGPMTSAMRIVSKVESYVDVARSRPIRISDICREIHVSRRTLHRAFHEAVGIGPVEFLRYRRLYSINSALRSGNPSTTTIADLAMQYGFLNAGRVSSYYHALFNEYPSQTLRRGITPVRTEALIAQIEP